MRALHRERVGPLSLTDFPALAEAGSVLRADASVEAQLRDMLPRHRVAEHTSSRREGDDAAPADDHAVVDVADVPDDAPAPPPRRATASSETARREWTGAAPPHVV